MSILRLLVILLLSVGLSVLSLLSTNTGSVFVLDKITTSVPALRLDLESGSILGRNLWQEVAWQDDQVNISAKNVSYQIDLTCLSLLTLCLQKLEMVSLDIDVANESESVTKVAVLESMVTDSQTGLIVAAQTSSNQLIEFDASLIKDYFAKIINKSELAINALHVENLSVKANGETLSQVDSLSTSLTWSKDSLLLDKTVITKVAVTQPVQDINEPNVPPVNWGNTNAKTVVDFISAKQRVFINWYKAQQFNFDIPITILWRDVRIGTLISFSQLEEQAVQTNADSRNNNQSKENYEWVVKEVATSGDLNQERIKLADLELTTPLGDIRASGTLGISTELPILLHMHSPDFLIADDLILSVTLKVSGYIKLLNLDVNTTGFLVSQSQLQVNILEPDLPFSVGFFVQHWQRSDIKLSNFAIKVQGDLNTTDLDVKGKVAFINGLPLDLKVSANTDFSHVNVELLKLKSLSTKQKSNYLSLRGVIESKSVALDGEIEVNNLPEIYKAIRPEVKNEITNVSGRISGKLNISGDILSPLISYDLFSEDLAVASTSINNITAKGSVQWSNTFAIATKIQAESLDIKGIEVTNIGLNVATLRSHNEDCYNIEITVDEDDYNFELAMLASLSEQNLQIEVSKGRALVLSEEWLLQKHSQVTYTVESQKLTVSKHCWVNQKAQICTEILPINTEHRLTARAAEISMSGFVSKLAQVSQLELQGLLSGQVIVNFNFEKVIDITSDFEVEGAELTLTGSDKETLALLGKVKMTLEFIDDKLITNLVIESEDFGDIDLGVSINGIFTTKIITGELIANSFQLAFLTPLFNGLSQFDGELSGSSKISGDLESPLFDGQFNLINGTISSEEFPAKLDNFNGELLVKGQNTQFMSSFESGNGNGSLSGIANWRESFKYSLQLQGDNFNFNDSKGVKFKYQPDIKFVGDLSSLVLTGDIEVPYARIEVKKLPASAVRVSRDAYIIDLDTQSDNDFSVSMNINIKLSDDVKIDSFGLQAYVSGKMQVSQNDKTDLAGIGTLQLSEGRYRSFGQDLTLRQGEIAFTGTLDNPYLNIEAIRNPNNTADDVIVGIRLLGFTDNPSLTLFSEPRLTRPEMTSYLLRGRNVDSQDNSSQDSILTSLLVAVSLGQGENLFTVLGEKVGVEDLAVETAGQGEETLVQISGYVLPGVQIRYGVGLFSALSEITVRYEFFPRLYAEFSSGLNSAVDLYYKFTR